MWIVLAVAHGRLARQASLPEPERTRHQAEARRRYAEAIKQIDASHDQDLFMRAVRAFRAEAAELLGDGAGKP
jgi:hypothetical protein